MVVLNGFLESYIYILSAVFSLVTFFALMEPRYARRATYWSAAFLFIFCAAVFCLGVTMGMSVIPASLLLLFAPLMTACHCLAELRGWRFLFTFFSVNVFSIDALALGRILFNYLGLNEMLTMACMFCAFLLIYLTVRLYRKEYRKILRSITAGWVAPTILSALFYVDIFISIYYPTEIVLRPEAIPTCVLTVVISIIEFFILLEMIQIAQKTAIMKQNARQLKSDMKLARMEKMMYFKQAYTDALTRLPNRAAYIKALEQLQSDEDTPPFVIWVLDANNLKRINDSHGHSSGDTLLRGIAQALRELDVPGISTYRTGGDEYAAIFEDCTLTQAGQYAREFNRILNRLNEDADVSISVSLGMAASDEGEDVQRVWELADSRMYESKKQYKLSRANVSQPPAT